MLTPIMSVAIGGAMGACMRYGIVRIITVPTTFPIAILLTNLLGCLLIGLIAGWVALRPISDNAQMFITMGLLGGFTTFSNFAMETITLIDRGDLIMACAYITLSVIGGLLLFFMARYGVITWLS